MAQYPGRSLNRRSLFPGALLAAALLAFHGARASAEPASVAFTLPDGVLYLDIVVNGKPSGQLRQVELRQGRYYLPVPVLEALGIKSAAQGDGLVAIDQIPGVTAELDNATQQLLVTVPPEWLPGQFLDLNHARDTSVPATSSSGLLMNYDAYLNRASARGNRHSTLSVWNEQRFFSPYGIVSSTGVWRAALQGKMADGTERFLRYDTQWRYNDPAAMRSYVAGDLITDALGDSGAVRMAGFRIGRNFATRPDLVTYPVPQFAGQAAVPTAVDLFINNYKIGSRDVGPGPFTLQSLPFINGAGTATVVTRDALGREVSQDVSFYVSNDLLKKGLSDYGASVGFLRRNYGVSSFDYGSLAASGVLRHGVTSGWTATGWAQGAPGFAAGGLGSNVQLGMLGVLSGSVAVSRIASDKLGRRQGSGMQDFNALRDPAQRFISVPAAGASAGSAASLSGTQWSLGHSYNNQRFGLSVRRTQRSDDFANLGSYQSQGRLSRREDQATASVSLGRYGSLGMGWFDVDYGPANRTRLMNLSYGVSFANGVNVHTSANREIGARGYNVQLSLSIPLGDNSSASASVSRDNSGRSTGRMNYAKAAPTSGGVGWNVGASQAGGGDSYQQADVNWRARNFDLRGGAYGSPGAYSQWAQLGGSVILMDSQLHLSRPVSDAFTLVSTDGQAGVPVRHENQYVGDTDANGHLLIPSVTSWYAASYEIDPINLPVDVKTPVARSVAAVRDGSGLLLRFPMETLRAAVFSIVRPDGQPLASGSQVQVDGADLAWVGRDGEVYLEQLPRTSRLVVLPADGGAACTVTLASVKPDPGIARLGKQICR